MTITVNLMSNKKGELKKFLKVHFNNEQIDDDVLEWMYIYNKPHEAIQTIENFINNSLGYNISVWVQVEDDDLISVDKSNKKNIVDRINRIDKD